MKILVNGLTVSRFFIALLVFGFLYFLPSGGMIVAKQGMVISLFLMSFAEFSDFADGWLARKFNAGSEFGKRLDPLADFFYHFFVFVVFAILGWMWWWLLIVFIVREGISHFYRYIMGLAQKNVSARMSGKIKSALYGTAQISIVVIKISPDLAILLLGLIAVGGAIWSGKDYLRLAFAEMDDIMTRLDDEDFDDELIV